MEPATKKTHLSGHFRKRVSAFSAAFKGLYFGWKEGIHFRFHLISVLLVIVAGTWLNVNSFEWCLLAFACGLVILTELINTAIEILSDRVTMEFDPLIGKVKDLSAAAVLISALTALIIGGIIFWPKLMERFQ